MQRTLDSSNMSAVANASGMPSPVPQLSFAGLQNGSVRSPGATTLTSPSRTPM
jgi:hypothetical protein